MKLAIIARDCPSPWDRECNPNFKKATFKYSAADEQKRILRVISKIPKADAKRFEVLPRSDKVRGEGRNMVSENLQELIFEGWEGMPTARDFPDLLVSVLRADILSFESDQQIRRCGYVPSLELETLFVLKEGLGHESMWLHSGQRPPAHEAHGQFALAWAIYVVGGYAFIVAYSRQLSTNKE